MTGENREIIWAHSGRLPTGTNTPLINITGNLTRFDSIITLAGLSVGKEENKEPNAAKQIEARIIVVIKTIKLLIVPPRTKIPAIIINTDILKLKQNPESISPRIIILIDPGVVSNLSRVRVLVSQGVIKGPTEEPAKKKEIASRPGINSFTAIPLPKAKARNRKNGNRIPYINIGASV
ncbi:MAG: hypothetical protein R6V14_04370 [Halanaerobiales bacterium]